MATTDVKLVVEAQARGVEGIQALAAQVRALAKDGGDAAPEFNRLAGELDRIADQSKAVLGLKQLETEIASLTAAQIKSAEIAQGTKAEYDREAVGAAVLATAHRAAAQAVDVAKLAHREAKDELANYRLKTTEAAQADKDHAGTVREKQIAIQKLKEALDAAKDAQRAAKESATGAAEVESIAGAAYAKSAAALAKAEVALRARTAALTDSRSAAAGAAVEVGDLAAAETRLSTELATAQLAIERQQAAVREMRNLDVQAVLAADRLGDALQRNATAYNEDTRAALAAAEAQAKLVAGQKAAAESALQFVLAEERVAKEAAAASAALDAIGAAARKLNADAQYVREFAAALDAADAKAKKAAEDLAALAAASAAASKGLQDAFGAAGVRSIAAIQAEINQTRQAVGLLERSFQAGAIGAYDLSRAVGSAEARMQTLRAEMMQLPAAVGVLERMNTAVLGLVNRFGALGAAVATVGFAVKPILDATLQLDSMRRVLTTVYGSFAEAGRQIEFVRKVAEASGLDVGKAGDAYTRFAASAKASGIETALVQKVFSATAQAAGNLGLSSDKTTHILDALGQMANKGTVSMEELRQQLGDSLPGALSLLAKGLGITEAQLVKIVTAGDLLTSEALGPLAEAMLTLGAPGGRVEGLRAAMERLGNQFTLAYQKIADTTFYKALTGLIDGLAKNFDAVTTAVKLLIEVLVVGKIVTATTNFLGLRAATLGVAGAMTVATTATGAQVVAAEASAVAAVAQAGALTRAGLAVGILGRGLLALVGGPIGALAALGLAAYEMGPAVGRLAAEFLGFRDRSAEVGKALDAAAESARKNALARDAEAGSIVRIKVLYAEQAQTLAVSTAAAEKQAKAVKDLGDAAIHTAELSGEEAAKLAAVTRARENDAVALSVVAAGKRAEADATEKLIAAEQKSIEGKGVLSAAMQAELAGLRDKLDLVGNLTAAETARLGELVKVEAEAKKGIVATQEQIRLGKEKLEGQRAASAEADAAVVKERALVESARLAAEAFKDTATSLGALKVEYVAALAREEDLRQGVELGVISQKKYWEAQDATARVLGRVHLATNDAVAAQERLIVQQREASALRQQDIALARVKIETDLKIADLTGQYSDKLNAQIRLKGLDLQAVQEGISALDKQAAALREEARLKADVLKVTDDNYAAKKREIDALNSSAASVANTAKIEQERLRMLVIEQGILNGTLYKGAQGFNALSDAAQSAENAALRYGSALRQTTYDAEKFALAADGARLAMLVGNGQTYTPGPGGGDGSGQSYYLNGKQYTPTVAAASNIAGLAATATATAKEAGRLNEYVQNNRAFNGAPILTTGVSPSFVEEQRNVVRAAAQEASGKYQAAQQALDLALRADKATRATDAQALQKTQGEAAQARAYGVTPADIVQAKSALTNAQNTTHSVTITLPGGRTGSVNVASALDGAELARLLAQLGQDQTRTGP